MLDVTKTYQSEIVTSDSPTLALSYTAALEAVLHVVDDSHPSKHAILLKHFSTFRPMFPNDGVSATNFAIQRRTNTRHPSPQFAFATPILTNYTHNLPFPTLTR